MLCCSFPSAIGELLTNGGISIFSTLAALFNQMFIYEREHDFLLLNDDIRAVTINEVMWLHCIELCTVDDNKSVFSHGYIQKCSRQ